MYSFPGCVCVIFCILFQSLALIVLLAFSTVSNAITQEKEVTVKRIHSRHRRFIAPGAIWDLLGGVEVLYPDSEIRFDLKISYQLDYLFGGTPALAGAIAAANAAAVAAEQAEMFATAAAAGGRSLKEGLVHV